MNGPENLIESPIKPAPLPDVLNHTGIPSQYFQMADAADQIFHVMVSRSTYDMCVLDETGELALADMQHPLNESDLFAGPVNGSAVLQESDYAPFKPRCDLLFPHAVAWAPGGQALGRWAVGVMVGEWSKRLTVTGPRELVREGQRWRLTEPMPATSVPVRYELAWGGTCQWPLESSDGVSGAVTAGEAAILAQDGRNPIGCGFLDPDWDRRARPARRRAPQIEPFGVAFDEDAAQRQEFPVVGLGAIGRWWLPRRQQAGTYDEAWKRSRWPGLPRDFDFGYWNCAPEDQQIAYPSGGEQVVLAGFHPEGPMRFRIPVPTLKLLLHLDVGVPLFKPMPIDTLVFDLQALELTVVQRGLVAASAGVERMELGTWDIAAARAANAVKLSGAGGMHGQ